MHSDDKIVQSTNSATIPQSLSRIKALILSFHKHKSRRTIAVNLAALSFLQYANYFLPLITIPYLTRVIGVERFGAVAFAQAFATYFSVLVNYGFSFSATREVAIKSDSKDELRQIYSDVLWAKLFLVALGFAVMVGFLLLLPRYRAEWALFVAAYTLVVGAMIASDWFFQGIEQMKFISIAGIVSRTVATLLVFVLVRSRADYIWVPALNGIGAIVGGCLGMWIIRKNFQILVGRPNLKGIARQLREGWDAFLASAFITLYTTSNVFILGLMTNTTLVGYYSAAEKIVSAINSLWAPVPRVLYPHFSKVFAQNQGAGKRHLRIVLLLVGVGTLVLALMGFVAAPMIVHYYIGRNFQASIPIIRILVFTVSAIGINNILGVQGLLANGMNKAFRNIVLCSGVLNVLLLLLFVNLFGAIGPAISVVILEYLICVAEWAVLRQRRLV